MLLDAWPFAFLLLLVPALLLLEAHAARRRRRALALLVDADLLPRLVPAVAGPLAPGPPCLPPRCRGRPRHRPGPAALGDGRAGDAAARPRHRRRARHLAQHAGPRRAAEPAGPGQGSRALAGRDPAPRGRASAGALHLRRPDRRAVPADPRPRAVPGPARGGQRRGRGPARQRARPGTPPGGGAAGRCRSGLHRSDPDQRRRGPRQRAPGGRPPRGRARLRPLHGRHRRSGQDHAGAGPPGRRRRGTSGLQGPDSADPDAPRHPDGDRRGGGRDLRPVGDGRAVAAAALPRAGSRPSPARRPRRGRRAPCSTASSSSWPSRSCSSLWRCSCAGGRRDKR